MHGQSKGGAENLISLLGQLLEWRHVLNIYLDVFDMYIIYMLFFAGPCNRRCTGTWQFWQELEQH